MAPVLLEVILVNTRIENIGQSDYDRPLYVPSEDFKVYFHDEHLIAAWLMIKY